MKKIELGTLCNRAFAHIFDARKFLAVFLVLLLSGLFVLFFQGFALCSPNWLKLPLLTLPVIIMGALLMVVGAGLNKMYAQEREGIKVNDLPFFSGEVMFRAACFFAPLIVAAVTLLLLLGLFLLIKSIPYVGTFFGIILAFAPFLINFALLLLFLIAFLILFLFTPLVAFKKHLDKKALMARLQGGLFNHVLLLGTILIPLWIIWKFVVHAADFTFKGYAAHDPSVIKVLQGLFMLIPMAAIFTLPLVFFFNFSFESFLLTEDGNRAPPESAADRS